MGRNMKSLKYRGNKICLSLYATAILMLSSCGGGGGSSIPPPTLSNIGVLPSTQTVELGQTSQFSAQGIYSNGSVQNFTNQVTWSSSDSAVAMIDSSGLATTFSTGSTNITASDGNFTSTPALMTVVLSKPLGMVLVFFTGKISVGWNPVVGATSYNLYWATTPGVTTNSNRVVGVTAPYSLTGVTDGTYYFRVSAVNSNSETLSSEMASCLYVGGIPVFP